MHQSVRSTGIQNAALLRPVCKAVIEVRHQSQIPGAIAQAFQIARSGEPGPTAVVIPYNLYSEVWDYQEPAPAHHHRCFDESRLQAGPFTCWPTIAAASASTRDKAAWTTRPQLAAVAELLQAPVATSVSGKGSLPEQHPLSVGWGYGAQGTRTAERTFQKDVDLVLAVGVRYSENSTANYAIPQHSRLIHVDANPHVLGKNVPADVASTRTAASS